MNVFITGGTSGIGLAVAERYLKQGHRVGICGRNIQKVNLSDPDFNLSPYQLDVYDKEALRKAVCDFAGDQLDLMIIAAGNYSESVIRRPSYQESTDMLRVNLVGSLNAFEVAREVMNLQGKGHIVAIASVAGLLDYPGASIYAKTKRTLIQVCDTYRRTLSGFGIQVTAVVPGYVDTPKLRELNDNDLSKKPFVMSLDHAVDVIIKAIDEKKAMIVFPVRMKILMGFLSLLPKKLLTFIMLKKAKWMQPKL